MLIPYSRPALELDLQELARYHSHSNEVIIKLNWSQG